jgi:hypothetical protein
LLAKALVHPPNSWCLKHSIREQARLPQGRCPIPDFQRGFSPGGDAERQRMHSHAERGDDRMSAFGRTSSRLKPVLLSVSALLIFLRKRLSHRQSRLWCRLNAGLAQWAEPQGCGESAVRTWMSVRRGPTEQDRSEGIPTKEEPNREQAPLVTWGWCDFRLFQVTRRRRNSLPPGRRP